MALYRSKKTGALYCTQGFVTNATKAQHGQMMTLYANTRGEMFCREYDEFAAKFELVDEESVQVTDSGKRQAN